MKAFAFFIFFSPGAPMDHMHVQFVAHQNAPIVIHPISPLNRGEPAPVYIHPLPIRPIERR